MTSSGGIACSASDGTGRAARTDSRCMLVTTQTRRSYRLSCIHASLLSVSPLLSVWRSPVPSHGRARRCAITVRARSVACQNENAASGTLTAVPTDDNCARPARSGTSLCHSQLATLPTWHATLRGVRLPSTPTLATSVRSERNGNVNATSRPLNEVLSGDGLSLRGSSMPPRFDA